jgi:hypothetical protein
MSTAATSISDAQAARPRSQTPTRMYASEAEKQKRLQDMIKKAESGISAQKPRSMSRNKERPSSRGNTRPLSQSDNVENAVPSNTRGKQ